jgi:hypothetical protein
VELIGRLNDGDESELPGDFPAKPTQYLTKDRDVKIEENNKI